MALWTPAEITTALWLDASDSSTLFDATTGGSTPANSGAVARWEDKSGNARNAIQPTSGSRPTRETSIQNSLDIIRFDGSSDFLNGAHVVISDAQSGCFIVSVAFSSVTLTQQRIITVLSSSAGNGVMQFFQRFSSTSKLETFGRGTALENTSSQSTANATGAWNVMTSRFNDVAGRVETSLNAATFVASDYGSAFTATAPTQYEIGSVTSSISTTQYLNGDIGEIVVVDSVPSSDVQDRLVGYIAWKWGLEGNLPAGHPYENAAPTIPSPNTRRRRYAGGYGL